MKKILMFTMIFSLVIMSGGFAFAQQQEETQNQQPKAEQKLEKVPNPQEIKFFEKIKKIGNTLFGIKKNEKAVQEQKKQEPAQDKSGQETTTDDSTALENPNLFTNLNRREEKISNPQELKFFEKIKKVNNTLFGVRKKEFQKPIFINAETAQCVKTAISKKGAALKTAMTEHDQKTLILLDTRIACESAALDKTSAQEQHDANKQCISADKKAGKENESAFEKLKKEIQKTYQEEVKLCLKNQKATSTPSTVSDN